MTDKLPQLMSGRARGRGRGAVTETPGPSQAADDNGNGRRDPTRGAGSGVVAQRGPWTDPAFTVRPSGPAAPLVRPGVPVIPLTAGRASIHGVPRPAAGAEGGRTSDLSRGARRGNRAITDIVVTRPVSMNSKRGETGEVIAIVANYFRVLKKPNWNIYKYRVDFTPDIELLGHRKGIMRRQMERLGAFQFDGTMIFSPFKFQHDPMVLMDINDRDESVQITIRLVGDLLPTDGTYTHLLNLIMRNTIESLNLQRAYGPKGTKYFDAQQKIDIREHKLQVWPGFSTSIRQHEADILICAEVTHKVIRMESCYNAMQELAKDVDGIKKLLIGQMVVTEYNNLTYRIDDVDFSLTPLSEFEKKGGEKITFMQYFRDRYNITIRDQRQPLLVSRAKARDIKAGRPEVLNLIPELCRLTGLTDHMRNDFRLMRDMAQHTRIGPDMRIKRFLDLNRRIQNEEKAKTVMKNWDMALDKQLVEFPGRVLPREEIKFGNDRSELPNNDADWTFTLKKNRMFEADRVSNWHIICPDRDHSLTMKFSSLLTSTAGKMGFQLAQPNFLRIPDDRATSYVNAIEKACNDSTQIILCVVPNQRGDRYSAIKKKSYVDRAVPTQVMWTKVMSNDKIIGGVVGKVAIQMNCKLGNAPWTVKVPLKNVMTCGFDVTYDANDKSKTFGAFVATMDIKECNTYYSAISHHKYGEEMSNFLIVNVFKALKQYEQIHKQPPARIFFYRDGVGEGDVNHVLNIEVARLREKLKSSYEEATPKLTFIVVTKRINTRLFRKMGNSVQNPPPGTVVDDVITLPERFDFFLVSQATRQGTISPTSYNVIFDESGLSPDKIQIWTYKMTHLYYNWSGNVKVPAVCQYAQKLALLVGQHIHQEPNTLLERQLYFL
ncbi:protein aubergine-like [Lutzomyia longipalpis]|uniref:protein aubergine-like n=1 Tax=Lutzomyia longipalpis TaxID=7200 RepID=UPI0024839D5B|nr:protein aubergine-like [Lutzomyia longipalpis]